MEFYNPRDFFPDDGSFDKLYPIPEPKRMTHLVFDNKIQRTSHIQGNIVAIFEKWFLSFFDSNYFANIRLKTQSSFADYKSFMKDIYKKDKPLMVIDVNASEHVDDSVFGLNMTNRYNLVDPQYDESSAKLLYSIGVFGTDDAELRFRRNRYRFTFDVLIMENTMDRQLNTYSNLLMNIRHRSKFMLSRSVLNLIPLEHIHNIAIFHKFNSYTSDEFMEFLNTHSAYPIIKRVGPNGKVMFYMRQEVHLYVEVPDNPQKDSPEMSAAFEHGAQIRDSFVIEADLPSEFIFVTSEPKAQMYVAGKDKDVENVYYVSPFMEWPEAPKMHGDYSLVNTLTVTVEEDDNELDIMADVIRYYDTNVYNLIVGFVKRGYPITDLLYIQVEGQMPNEDVIDKSFSMTPEGVITIPDADFRALYRVLVYIDFLKLNAIRDGSYREFIGTIEKY